MIKILKRKRTELENGTKYEQPELIDIVQPNLKGDHPYNPCSVGNGDAGCGEGIGASSCGSGTGIVE
ncbi:MAG: hypothetical protein NT099_08855 [Candidatus Saganbacteria bacterium]|nr:hypothetical protein [Candidatus Saganbacteria bacterium]